MRLSVLSRTTTLEARNACTGFNDGRYLGTDLKLLDEAKGFTWHFEIGEIKTVAVDT